jgi:hypothetical protein
VHPPGEAIFLDNKIFFPRISCPREEGIPPGIASRGGGGASSEAARITITMIAPPLGLLKREGSIIRRKLITPAFSRLFYARCNAAGKKKAAIHLAAQE